VFCNVQQWTMSHDKACFDGGYLHFKYNVFPSLNDDFQTAVIAFYTISNQLSTLYVFGRY
jgi:hypothetical protein